MRYVAQHLCGACLKFFSRKRHLSMRLVLFAIAKVIPWNYAQFLDYCVERRLVQRVGERYSGSHASEVHQSRGDTAVRPPICTAPDR